MVHRDDADVTLLESRSPQLPSRLLARFAEASLSEVEAAVGRARKAQRQWHRMPATSRANTLGECAESLSQASAELIELGIAEIGKPRREMAAELARGIGILRYYAQSALDPDGQTYPSPEGVSVLLSWHRPRGVVGLITPWNFPVAIPLWKAAPALAYGNAVLLKPAPAATAMALKLAKVLEPKLPSGLFQIITGGVTAGKAVVEVADAISFTGSRAVGRSVVSAAAARGVPVQAEMGGQNPAIVLPDADLGWVAEVVAAAAMSYAGQKCTATSRIIVVGDPAPFTDALVAAVEALTYGDPSDEDVVVGPVIDDASRRAVLRAVEMARADGGQILTGGVTPDRVGYFVDPTLVRGIGADHHLAQEELFGPFALVLSSTDQDEAVRIANQSRYGLVASVFTRDLNAALTMVSQLRAGMVRINGPTTGVDLYAPFGGTKDSSYGTREQGKAALDFYTETQTVTLATASGHAGSSSKEGR